MRNMGNSILLLLSVAFFIGQFHFGYTKNYSYSNNATCIETERRALLDFKGSLVDTANRLASWTTGEDCCSWYGIICNSRTGHVEKLNLGSSFRKYLGGEINPSILKLKHLNYLDLSSNNFSGIQIPTFLGSLKNLTYLNLTHAGFGGEIPPHLGNLSNLQYLYLTSNFLTSKSLMWITGLPSLKALDLSGTNLSESFDWLNSISMLPSLSSLSLRGCQLDAGVSPPLSPVVNLTSLVFLDISNNSFQGSFPLWVGKLISLRVLDLARSKFGGKIPSELGQLKQLTSLDLSSNDFKCSIPSGFGQLSQLENLDLSHNQLYGEIPSTLWQLTKLQNLDISDNSLIGDLSESHFVNLKSLKLLSISRNYFLSFNVSSQWVPPFQLGVIHMDSIQLGSQFPPWLQTQRDVEILTMSNASISGVVPSWFTTFCSSIKTLNLSSNNIHGSLISFPPNIQTLDLSKNSFTLSDTNYMKNMTLTTLRLDHNLLAGNVPKDLCNLLQLLVLSLASNQLTGSIPPCFGNLRQLVVLDLANNSLSGQVPSTLGNLTLLVRLHLSRNKLHGLLPSSLKNLKSLKTLDVGVNNLSGTIPEWIGKELLDLHFLRLESNHFGGNISTHLCQLSFLQIINLGENNLVGQIPRCFGNLSMMQSTNPSAVGSFGTFPEALWNTMKGIELQYTWNLQFAKFISLSGNKLHGEIPTELLDLKGLQNLNLSNNKLSGRIPENIGVLKHLESLDLAVNQLSGVIPQSLANIDTLCFMNLSFNNLVGRIPSGNHLDTLYNQSIYEGNSGLCGKPLPKRCPDDKPPSGEEPAFLRNIDVEFEWLWFYAGLAPGFAVGLVGVFCILRFKGSWRHVYFEFVDDIYERVWITFAVGIRRLQRKLN